MPYFHFDLVIGEEFKGQSGMILEDTQIAGIGFGNRKVVATDRSASLKGGNATAVFAGGALPIGNGRMLTGSMMGPPLTVVAAPWAFTVVPCGMDAMRATVVGSAGLVVTGTVTQKPGST